MSFPVFCVGGRVSSTWAMSAAFLGALAGGCLRNKAAWTRTITLVESWHGMQQAV